MKTIARLLLLISLPVFAAAQQCTTAGTVVTGTIALVGPTCTPFQNFLAGGIHLTGSSALPAATNSGLWMASGFASPVIGRIYIGDGTGMSLSFAKRTGGVDTEMMHFVDDGSAVFDGGVTTEGVFTGLGINITGGGGVAGWLSYVTGSSNLTLTSATSLDFITAGNIRQLTLDGSGNFHYGTNLQTLIDVNRNLFPTAVTASGTVTAPSFVGPLTGTATTISGSIPEAQVTGLATSLSLLAPLASPALTGKPTVPTAASGTSTTQAASTAFVQNAVATSGSNTLVFGRITIIAGTSEGNDASHTNLSQTSDCVASPLLETTVVPSASQFTINMSPQNIAIVLPANITSKQDYMYICKP